MNTSTRSTRPESPMTISRACRQGHEGCDLNSVNEIEITPQEVVFDGEGNRLLPSAGPGEGVRPHDTAPGRSARRLFPQEINAMKLSTDPVAVLLLGPPFYK